MQNGARPEKHSQGSTPPEMLCTPKSSRCVAGRQGKYWPSMPKPGDREQMACPLAVVSDNPRSIELEGQCLLQMLL